MIPLPGQSQLGSFVEVVADYQFRLFIISLYGYFHYRRHFAIFVPQHGPTIFPTARHQHRYTAYGFVVLKQHSIPFACFCIDEASLCYTVIGISEIIRKNGFHLIRSGHFIGTEAELCAYAAFRPPDQSEVIFTIEFIEVSAFQ